MRGRSRQFGSFPQLREILPSCLLGLTLSSPGQSRAIDFATEIRPLFERHCVECHGAERQKSGFRLDLRAAAMKGGSDGPAIAPGRSAESPLIAHVSAPAGDELRMPPKGEGLSADEVALLARWIDAGAPWPDDFAGADERLSHWAWQPLSKAGEEILEKAPGHPVDVLLERRLAEAGLGFSPEAGRGTLLRRLSFDLHGLPPGAVDREPSAPDSSPSNADRINDAEWSALVDSYLASTHFGERFARHWLDLAHYADTHGFERDKRRDHAWRYRDYVIDSFNEDKPYARFLCEQIAGDVLWPDDPEAVVATGFLAAGPWDFVGQVEAKSPVLRRSARALDLDDMVTQVMAATVGVTVNCARCHDHKLDPVSQEEYYRLWSVFAGVRRDDRVVSAGELAAHESAKARLGAELDRLGREIARLEGRGVDLADLVGGGKGSGEGRPGQGIDPRSGEVASPKGGGLSEVVPNRYAPSPNPYIDGVFVPDGGEGGSPVPISSTGLVATGLPKTSGAAWDAIRNGPVAAQHSTVTGGIDFGGEGRSLLGLHANAGITFDLAVIRENAAAGEMRFSAKLAYFGADGGHRADAWIFLDGEKVFEARGLSREDGLREVDLPIPATVRFLTLVSTDGGDGYGHDQIGYGDPRLLPHPDPGLGEAEAKAKAKKLHRLREERKAVQAQFGGLVEPAKVYAVVAEASVPEVRLLRRGDPESPDGDALPPGSLALLPGLDPDLGGLASDEGRRRAALADWIVHPDNVLMRRVIVNRLWQWVFGQGIVATPSDFGLGGGRPSHPELLDWLAAEFERKGGSVKEILRLLLTSRAYRQDSRFSDLSPGVRIDAGNRLLWRQNSRRIEAEAVRDAVLAVSGRLTMERGGPGFEDFAYEEAYAPIYRYVTADEPALWRRSIYRYVVRTTPNRFMTTLDCPDPASLAPRRNVTTTPLQSLALYNNDFMLRQARYFAARLADEGGDPVVRGYGLAFGRAPTPEEAELARDFVEREGLFAFCRALFNANEFVYVD